MPMPSTPWTSKCWRREPLPRWSPRTTASSVRLTGDEPGWEAAAAVSAKTGAVVVLKGGPTFVTGEQVWAVTSGGPELATVGTGDVLTGMIAALIARGLGPRDGRPVGRTSPRPGCRRAECADQCDRHRPDGRDRGVGVRPTWIEIDLGAIRENVAAIAAAVAPAEVCAVVKADGYGHGDVPAAEAAREGGATWLAVALVAEGARLREAGVEGPILLLSEPFPEEVTEIVRWELTPTVYRESFLDALAEAAPAGYPAHLKVDTGMHRVGASPEEAGRLAGLIEQKGLRLEGAWTHFAVSEEDPDFTAEQTARLMGFLGGLAAEGIVPAILHASNTAGALGAPEARLDMVRAGIGIYGLRPAPDFQPEVALRPAMRVVSHVSFLQRLPAGERPSYGRVRPVAGGIHGGDRTDRVRRRGAAPIARSGRPGPHPGEAVPVCRECDHGPDRHRPG